MTSKKDFTGVEYEVCIVIDDLATTCYERSREKGFWQDQDQLVAIITAAPVMTDIVQKRLLTALEKAFTSQKNDLMHSELGEATEAQRKDLPSDKLPGFTGEEEEYADCIIRILDLAGRKKMRLGEAVVLKMRYNAGREFMHGKKF